MACVLWPGLVPNADYRADARNTIGWNPKKAHNDINHIWLSNGRFGCHEEFSSSFFFQFYIAICERRQEYRQITSIPRHTNIYTLFGKKGVVKHFDTRKRTTNVHKSHTHTHREVVEVVDTLQYDNMRWWPISWKGSGCRLALAKPTHLPAVRCRCNFVQNDRKSTTELDLRMDGDAVGDVAGVSIRSSYSSPLRTFASSTVSPSFGIGDEHRDLDRLRPRRKLRNEKRCFSSGDGLPHSELSETIVDGTIRLRVFCCRWFVERFSCDFLRKLMIGNAILFSYIFR